MADLKDKKIGGFRILAEIKGASGSQGQIFKAVCEKPPFAGIEPGTVVALKAMAVHDEDGQAWAKLEKRTGELVRLSHPNVVKYYGCFSEPGTFNDTHAIVQEFLDGETLKQRLARCPSGLDADEALHVTEAALAGLAYTAANGIVHRDVKPGNIFLCSDGRVKLIDFEIAHQEGGTTTSASGNLVGSFDYMAPDFTNSTFRGDEQSDVFSMGVVMHEAITGRTPYQRIEGSSGRADFAFLSRWARLHVDGTNPIKISSRANRLLAHSDEVLAKALAPFPQDRYASFAEFHAGLKAIRYRDLRNGENVYRILQIIGKGGFGEVFKARLKGTLQLVAIKHLLKAAYAQRFFREAKIMARLHDPCFVRFIDFFVVDHAGSREAFLVMDFLPGMPGSSLRDAIKRAGGSALPFRETLLAFARFAHGLSALHARGIFHRDIKPSNLYYPEGCPERAAIMDLGIARDIHGSITTGQVPGTLDYMPPEVVLTDNRGEAGMDIYALGLCLYEALSGKTAYPRLPQGPSAITSFLARANIKAMPDLSDPAIVENAPLHELLVRMTNPDLSERITDTSAVERALADLAGTAQLPTVPAEEDEDDDETGMASGTLSISSLEETSPDEPDAPEPGTHGTIATVGTLATSATGEGSIQAIEQERVRVEEGRRRRRLFIGLVSAAAAAAVCGAIWAFRDRIPGWPKGSDATPAVQQAKHAQEMARLDEAAEVAADDVVAVYSNSETAIKACDEQFDAWRTEWEPRCSPAKFGELVKRIGKARTGSLYDRFRKAAKRLEMRYGNRQVAVEDNDREAERWRSATMRPDGFPDEEYKNLDDQMKAARTARIKTDNRWKAEEALRDVVEQYRDGTENARDVGDEKANVWRKDWKGKLDDGVFTEMDTRIATARADCVKAIRDKLIETNKKKCENESDAIRREYANDSSDKAKTDARYDKWVAAWKSNRNLPPDWFESHVKKVADAKRAREERIAKVIKDANHALQAVILAYGDRTKDIDITKIDSQAESWRKDWKEKLKSSAGEFFQMSAQIDSAREKRVNHDKWIENQRILAAKTNEVETVRAELVGAYRKLNVSARDADKTKAAIDGRFEKWAAQWEKDGSLQKALPNWFMQQRKTVEVAKDACEADIAKAKNDQIVRAKTNEVVTVQGRLVSGYKTDTSDKAGLDQSYTEWILKWSADADLPPGWFAEQRRPVEKEKTAREVRDERKRQEQRASKDAESVCETYRSDGLVMGDGSRKMWINAWTNTLKSAVFQKFSEKIGNARKERERVDKEKEDENQRIAKEAAKLRAERDAAKRQEEVARQKAERERMQRVLAKTNEVARVQAQFVNGYKDDSSNKAKLDGEFTEQAQKWKNDVDLPSDWLAEQVDAVEKEKSAREKREDDRKRAREQASQVCDFYRKSGRAAGDVSRTMWINTWTNLLGKAVFSDLSRQIDKARADAVVPEPPKPKPDKGEDVRKRQLVASKQKDAGTMRKQLEEGYKTDTADKADLDKNFAEWIAKWKADADLPTGWFAEQMIAVEREKIARERRDEDRKRNVRLATERAESVCKLYDRSGVAIGDEYRDEWIRSWTNVLEVAVFRGLSEKIGKSRANRKELDDKIVADKDKARIKKKQDQARNGADDLVRAYGNAAIARAETDRSFTAWRDKWGVDADLSADWFAGLRKEVEKAQNERIARDVAEKNRKDAWDDVVRVRNGYASGVAAGESERQIWDGKWKPVLDEATYKSISTIIEQDHKKAVDKAEAERRKAEAERRKAERERLEKDIRATLSVDRDHVERWKGQLADAEQKIAKGKSDGVLDAQGADALQDEVNLRKRWVVGVVVNQTQQAIEVAGRKVASGQGEFFEFRGGMPAGGLSVTCAGYKPLAIGKDALDGAVVQIGSGKWKLDPLPKARIRVPALEDGVTCLVDGKEREGGSEIELATGRHNYVYRLKNHEDQKGTFAVEHGDVKKLPEPGKWRVDRTLEEYFTRKLKDVERCFEVNDGEMILRIYHEIREKGYRLTDDDKGSVEEAFGICKEDYKLKRERAIRDPRYKEEDVRKWWDEVLLIYNDLTGKR